MQNFLKYAYLKVIYREKRNSHRAISTLKGYLLIQNHFQKGIISTKCNLNKIDRKLLNVLRDYVVERENENKHRSSIHNTNEDINVVGRPPGRREILHHRKNDIDIFHIDRGIFESLKNVFSTIDKINVQFIQNVLISSKDSSRGNRKIACKIVQKRVHINEQEYLFCIELPKEWINDNPKISETSYQGKKNILPYDDFTHLHGEMQNVDFFALSTLFRLYHKISRKKNYDHECSNFNIAFPYDKMNMFVLKLLCIHIDNIISNGKNKKIHTRTIKSLPQVVTNNKLPFHAIYWEMLNILQILKENKSEYIKIINYILYTQFEVVYKHKHHYNYAYSITLLPLLNELILYESNCLTTWPKKENHSKIKPFSISIGKNNFYMHKESYTWDYIEENYKDKEQSSIEISNSTGTKCNIDSIYRNNGKTTLDQKCTSIKKSLNDCDANLPTINGNHLVHYEQCEKLKKTENFEANEHTSEEMDIFANIFFFSQNSIEKKINLIFSKNVKCPYLLQYCIIVLTRIAKKIKYKEKRNFLIDQSYILEGIHTLLYVTNDTHGQLTSLINEKSEFLKNMNCTSRNDHNCVSEKMYLLLFLDFTFKFLKNVKYDYKSMEKTTSKGEIFSQNFLKILCLTSSIRHLLTSGGKKKKNDSERKCIPFSNLDNNDISQDSEQVKENELISRINKYIGLLNSEIILSRLNYFSPTHSGWEEITSAYMAYLLNDLYMQNNLDIKKMIVSYFLKDYKLLNSGSLRIYKKEQIYLEYITIYNFVKIFKSEINQVEKGYENVLNIFTTFLDTSRICQKINTNNSSKILCEIQMKQEQLLHQINKLCYLYLLIKRYITNPNFVTLINYNFYLTVCLINQYIEKNMNNSENVPQFANKCVNKITSIVVTMKCFNIPPEEDLTKSVSKLVTLTHTCMNEENKKNILFFVIPYMKSGKEDINDLENLLTDTKNLAHESKMKQEDNKEKGSTNMCHEEEWTNKNKKTCVIIPTCMLNEKKKKKKKIDFKNSDQQNNHPNHDDNTHLSIKRNLHYVEKSITQILANFEKNKNFCINNNQLYELLHEQMKGNHLIKKENTLLKNKLNYIFLNLDTFITSHIARLVSKKDFHFVNQDEKTMQKDNFYPKSQHHPSYQTDNEVTMKDNDITTTAETTMMMMINAKDEETEERVVSHHDREEAPTLGIHFDYEQVTAKNEYFQELKKYENENYIKINNVLINMYMCNPHICTKRKNIMVFSNGKIQKKMIILPHDTYKNIRKFLITTQRVDRLKLLKRLHNSIYLLFIKVKFFFNRQC
ncbi:hypothetical protein, conserved [Plasmodium gonderi]|uniref:Uncharacterized protein n=1 Tax=Plasmodium gonderi TaxID=77519 RepID=A0A1Y1JHF6_PLAGO|nr:hypothetical protein, conserved [Plasmodium gonderi]GAW80775.1 hypothetical protein, conserved [Plasmodium gonderi]